MGFLSRFCPVSQLHLVSIFEKIFIKNTLFWKESGERRRRERLLGSFGTSTKLKIESENLYLKEIGEKLVENERRKERSQ